MIELCACSHANDHVGQRCRHQYGDGMCPCKSGMRVDLATMRLARQTNQLLDQVHSVLQRVLAIAETASGLQTAIVVDEAGAHVNVERRKDQPALIIPR